MKFLAELKNLNMRKTSSGDIEYRVQFITNNPEVLALGVLKPEQLVIVNIEKPGENEPAER